MMRSHGLAEITETHEAKPSPEREKFASLAHGAQFVEVKVDPDLGTRPGSVDHADKLL